jgi:hypothetical protein
VTRESIPRFDLYGELGIGRDASADEIESAYRVRLGERPATGTGALASRRRERLARAREWLLDPERRARYDAAPDRTIPAAAAAAASWPAADLARSGTTPAAPALEPARPPDRAPIAASARRPRSGAWLSFPAVLALTVIVSVAVVGGILLALSGNGGTAIATQTAAAAGPTGAPTQFATAIPTVEPTVVPTVEPTTPAPSGLPVADLRQGAWTALQTLEAAAAAGDVAMAQTVLGDTAPGLRASGLRLAVFPQVASPDDIGIGRDGEAYTAVLGNGDRLTSPDGAIWTFDYSDRPLAEYRGGGEHDYFWLDPRQDVTVRITSAVLERVTMTVSVAWQRSPDTAATFGQIKVSAVTFGSVATAGDSEIIQLASDSPHTFVYAVNTSVGVPDGVSIVITLTNPRRDGGAGRAIDSTFLLSVR